MGGGRDSWAWGSDAHTMALWNLSWWPECSLCSRAGPWRWAPQVSVAPGQPHHQPGRAALAACSTCSCEPCPPSPTCPFWPAPSGQLLPVWSVVFPFHTCRSVIFFTFLWSLSPCCWWSSHVMGAWGGLFKAIILPLGVYYGCSLSRLMYYLSCLVLLAALFDPQHINIRIRHSSTHSISYKLIRTFPSLSQAAFV